MPRIRLLLGRQHRHRHRFRREQATQGDSIGSVRQAMHNGTNPGIPTASDSGCLVDLDSHPVFGRFSVPKKEVMSSVSNAGCLVDLDSHPVFGRFSVPKKEVVSSVSNAVTAPAPQFTFGTLGGPSRSSLHAGLSVDCVSLPMSSPLAYNAKSCGIPFLSLSVTAAVPQFISGTLGGPFRSISAHAGLPVGHVSQMSSPLACNAKSFGIPFVSLSVTATDQQFISGSSGGPSRSFSVHAGCVSQADSLPDRVKIGDNQDFKAKMSAEKMRIAANISGFKDRYFKFVRPILASRCLIAPAGLGDPSIIFLHQQTHKIANHNPRYLSIFDIMSYEDGVRDTLEWGQFLEHLTERRIYIIEDIDVEDEEKKDKKNKKDLKLSMSSIEVLLYDHGIKGPHDGMNVDFYKGECDASYVKGKANLSYMIWKDDTIVFSEIYKDIDISCTSVTEAEVLAAFALLSKARELKIQKLLLCSDCVTVSEIISGQLIIDRDHLHRDTYLMLRSMRRYFKNLIATWKPRELMSFVDDVAKSDDRYDGKLLFKNLKKKWSSHLKGLPLFRIEWTKSTKATVKKFAKTQVDESFGTNSNSVFFVGVDENIKLDCLIGINESLVPNNLVVYVNNIEDRPQCFIVDLKKVVGKHTETKFGSYSCFTAEHTPQDAVKTLVVVFDAAVPQEIYYHGDKSFHVLFVTDEEMKIVNENNIPKLTALGFVYFHGVKHPLNDPINKKNGDQTLGEDEEPKLSSVAEGEEAEGEEESCA